MGGRSHGGCGEGSRVPCSPVPEVAGGSAGCPPPRWHPWQCRAARQSAGSGCQRAARAAGRGPRSGARGAPAPAPSWPVPAPAPPSGPRKLPAKQKSAGGGQRGTAAPWGEQTPPDSHSLQPALGEGGAAPVCWGSTPHPSWPSPGPNRHPISRGCPLPAPLAVPHLVAVYGGTCLLLLAPATHQLPGEMRARLGSSPQPLQHSLPLSSSRHPKPLWVPRSGAAGRCWHHPVSPSHPQACTCSFARGQKTARTKTAVTGGAR